MSKKVALTAFWMAPKSDWSQWMWNIRPTLWQVLLLQGTFSNRKACWPLGGKEREGEKKHCKCMLPFTFRQWQRALVMSNVSNVHVISWSVLCLCRVCYLATITPRWVLAGSLMLRIIWSYRLLQQHDICYALGIDKLKCYNILI